MIFSKEGYQNIEAEIKKKPLEEGELRRVEELGNIFISRTNFPLDSEGEYFRLGWVYWLLRIRLFDGVAYYIYGGAKANIDETQTGPS